MVRYIIKAKKLKYILPNKQQNTLCNTTTYIITNNKID